MLHGDLLDLQHKLSGFITEPSKQPASPDSMTLQDLQFDTCKTTQDSFPLPSALDPQASQFCSI